MTWDSGKPCNVEPCDYSNPLSSVYLNVPFKSFHFAFFSTAFVFFRYLCLLQMWAPFIFFSGQIWTSNAVASFFYPFENRFTFQKTWIRGSRQLWLLCFKGYFMYFFFALLIFFFCLFLKQICLLYISILYLLKNDHKMTN